MRGGGESGVLVLLAFGGGGGVVQNRESPDFRSPEVGRYEEVLYAHTCYYNETLLIELRHKQLEIFRFLKTQ